MTISRGHIMGWHKRFTVFFIPLVLISTLVAVSHYHADTTDHHECPICVVNHHQPAADPSVFALEGNPFFIETTFVSTTQDFTAYLFSFPRNNRAPPA